MLKPQDQPSDNISFGQYDGLRNTITQERLGPGDLASAINVDIDDAKQIHRRRGYDLKNSGNYHSLFRASNGMVYVVKNNILCLLNANYSTISLQTDIGSSYLTYVSIGDDTYFSSQTDSGIIHINNTVSDWGQVVDDGFWYSPVVNPTSNLPPIRGKQLAAPPMATALTYWNGRIYLAQDKVLWATELYLYNYVDKTKNYRYFEAPITVLGTVSDGIYVGTEESLWYLTGTFNELKRTHLGNIKCISGTMTEVSQELALPAARANPGIPEKVDDALLVMSTTGLLLLMSGGTVYNLTQERMWFPDARSGTSIVRRQDGINQFVTCLDSGGTPSQNARFGDHLDATLIRFTGVVPQVDVVEDFGYLVALGML